MRKIDKATQTILKARSLIWQTLNYFLRDKKEQALYIGENFEIDEQFTKYTNGIFKNSRNFSIWENLLNTTLSLEEKNYIADLIYEHEQLEQRRHNFLVAKNNHVLKTFSSLSRFSQLIIRRNKKKLKKLLYKIKKHKACELNPEFNSITEFAKYIKSWFYLYFPIICLGAVIYKSLLSHSLALGPKFQTHWGDYIITTIHGLCGPLITLLISIGILIHIVRKIISTPQIQNGKKNPICLIDWLEGIALLLFLWLILKEYYVVIFILCVPVLIKLYSIFVIRFIRGKAMLSIFIFLVSSSIFLGAVVISAFKELQKKNSVIHVIRK